LQAYRLYTLALAKAPEMGAMNRLREHNNMSSQSRWRLAAAYALAGQPETAQNLINGLETKVVAYKEASWSYGSAERDMAMILETLTLLGEKTKAATLLKEIANAMSSNQWMSTQTTAYCLIGISKYIGKTGSNKEMKFNYRLNNEKNINVSTKAAIVQQNIKVKGSQNGNVEVKNIGEGLIYARIILEGTPEAGNETNSENHLQMSLTYKDLKGNTIDPSRLEQGTDFLAEVSIFNKGTAGHLRDIALTQIFPSGWEIHNSRMDTEDLQDNYKNYNYQDIRDDRVNTYFHLNMNKGKTFTIKLNAAYLGKFYLPACYVEAMYNKNANAVKAGKWVEVVSPGNIQ
jgi:alpha-2-macroglobulin